MAAIILNLTIEQGATWDHQLIWQDAINTPINLTGYTAVLAIAATFDATTALLVLTTENGYITLGGAAGTIDLTLPASITGAVTWRAAVYTLELKTGVIVKRLTQGAITVSPQVTETTLP